MFFPERPVNYLGVTWIVLPSDEPVSFNVVLPEDRNDDTAAVSLSRFVETGD